MKRTIFTLCLSITFLFGCDNTSKQNTTANKTNEETFLNKWSNQKACFDSLMTYKTPDEYDFIIPNIFRNKSDSTFYFLTCRHDGLAILNQLNESIDIESLIDYGEFWTDKNSVYGEYSTSDGVQFYKLKKADRATFKSFGKSIYARDRNHIFDSRHGIIEEADLESFWPIAIDRTTGISVYGKDKYNYFFWDEIVDDTMELKEYFKFESE